MSGGKAIGYVQIEEGTPVAFSFQHSEATGCIEPLALQSDLAAAIARAEAEGRDAARYRGIRSVVLSERLDLVPPVPGEKTPDTFDAWIDAAIAAQQAEGES